MNNERRADLVLHSFVGGTFAATTLGIGYLLIALVSGASVLAPARLMASFAIGGPALSWSNESAVVVAAVIHLALAISFAFIFLASTRPLLETLAPGGLTLVGMVYGAGLWALNMLVVAPLLLPEIAAKPPPISGLIAHAFLYGGVLGGYSGLVCTRASRRERARPSSTSIRSVQRLS